MPIETPYSNGRKLPTVPEIAELRAKYEGQDEALRALVDAAYSHMVAASNTQDPAQKQAELTAALETFGKLVTPVQSMRYAAQQLAIGAHVVAEHIKVLEGRITDLEARYIALRDQAEDAYQAGLDHAALDTLALGEGRKAVLLDKIEEAEGDVEAVRLEVLRALEVSLREARAEYDYWQAYSKDLAIDPVIDPDPEYRAAS